MAVDVLSYNAQNCRNQQLAEPIDIFNRGTFHRCPSNTTLWNTYIPMCITSGTVLNVCDTTGNFRCGACCQWTVPAGVTRAQFQLWGAGAGTGGGSCCNRVLPGSTGAYAIVTIPVTAGCQYTICAGCALSCYSQDPSAFSGCNITDGCASFVTGFGLTNLCAEGARGGMCHFACNWGTSKTSLGSISDSPLSLVAQGIQNSRYTFCGSGSAACGSTTGLNIPILRSDRTFYGNTAFTGINVCGLPSMSAGICINTSAHGFHLPPPVVTPQCATLPVVDTSFTSNNLFCQVFTSGTCGGWCCSAISSNSTCPLFRWPGQGGVGVHALGGSCMCGDAGRMGMVKVTYC